MDIFVANIPFDATEDDIREHFEVFGAIERINIVTDRETGRPRGFCFVGMCHHNDALTAIEALDGIVLGGRRLSLSRARERRPGRGV